ncbi:hypothetical protein B2I51_002541 [Escherichia coli]|nr:hypothetical protein [Escherichia coli]
MSTTIVFVVIHEGEVVNVCEYEELAKATAARYPDAKIDPWILDSRNVLQATLDEWLMGRKVYPVQSIESLEGETVYFEDECVRGIGKFIGLCPSNSKNLFYKIHVEEGDLFDKITRSIVPGNGTPIFMAESDIKGIIK